MDQRDQMVRPSADARVTGHRRRRPTGAAPPLPKEIGYTGWVWLVLLARGRRLRVPVAPRRPRPARRVRREDHRAVISFRTGWLDAFAPKAHTIGSRVGFAALAIAARARDGVVPPVAPSRDLDDLPRRSPARLLQGLELVSIRPRPFGVRQIASWEGFATPSIPIGAMAILSIGVAYMLVVPGRPRYWAKLAAAVAIAIVGRAADLPRRRPLSPTSSFGAIVGVAIPLVAFRAFAPNDIFPVAVRRSTGRRRTST